MIKNLKLVRKANKISQKQLSELLGVSQQTIARYEKGKSEPDITTLVRLANFFHVSVDYLVGNTDSMYPRILSQEDVKIMENIQNSLYQLLGEHNDEEE